MSIYSVYIYASLFCIPLKKMNNNSIFTSLNALLKNPTKENIFELFEKDGFIRLNMLYMSPLSLYHLREKLSEFGNMAWSISETEMIFRTEFQVICFRGTFRLSFRGNKLFSMELDFDPIISGEDCKHFLKEVEAFLKQCDTCFFMSYPMSIDSEILDNPLSESIGFLISRK